MYSSYLIERKKGRREGGREGDGREGGWEELEEGEKGRGRGLEQG